MNAISSVSVTPYTISLVWTAINSSIDGGDTPYYYELYWQDPVTMLWVPLINN